MTRGSARAMSGAWQGWVVFTPLERIAAIDEVYPFIDGAVPTVV